VQTSSSQLLRYLREAQIAFSPLTPAVVFAGINNNGNNPLFVFPPQLFRGVLRSTDGGVTWRILPTGSAPASGRVAGGVTSIVPTRLAVDGTVDTQVVLASATTGIWRSANGGQSWVNLSGIVGDGLPANAGVSDLVEDPGDPAGSRFYAGIPGFGIFRSRNGGLNWEAINGGIGTPASIARIFRIRLSVHFNRTTRTNSVFVAIGRTACAPGAPCSAPPGVLVSRSADATTAAAGAVTWTAMSFISDCRGTLTPGGQILTNLSLAADRDDPNVVFAGGDRSRSCGFELNLTARIFRGDASRALGQWDSITNLGAVGPPLSGFVGSAPHADFAQHGV
jgi:hypothetical protein